MAPTALSTSATAGMSTSPELSASAKEFVPGSFAGTGALGASTCTGFHFDPSACEFNPMMAVPSQNAMQVSAINFACYSSDDDDTPPPSPRPVASTVQNLAPKVEIPLVKEKVQTSIAATHERSDAPTAETTDELCKGSTAVAPWKRKQSDSPKSPAAKQQSEQLGSPKSPQALNNSEGKSAPWRKTEDVPEPPSSKPLRPWHNKSKKEEEEDKEAASASLSDASTESPVSTGGGSPKSMSPESADDQDFDGVESPCVSPTKEGPTIRLTTSLSGYLGPQRPKKEKAASPTFSVMEMMQWRAAAIDLKPDNFTYSVESVDMSESPATGGASKTQKGSWREDASRSQRTSRNARRAEGRGASNLKQDEEVAPLQKSDNSWVSQQEERRARKSLNPEGKTDEEIVRSMKSILNKLTIEKYDKLYLQMVSCGISTVQHVKILIHEVMEKAQTQHHFIEMYTTLCMHLHEWFNENEVSDDPKTGFKRILLNECQGLFEGCLKQEDNSGLDGEELAEAKAKYKLKMLGNIKFVGALLGKRMLATSVLVAIAEDLISEPCSPEALESLAVFLTSVGETFDRPDWQHHKRLDAVFGQLEGKKSDKKVPARIRFLLQDVLDLRASGWEDQKKATKKNEGPMKLEDVHEKASEEEKAKSQWQETPKWQETSWREAQGRAPQRPCRAY